MKVRSIIGATTAAAALSLVAIPSGHAQLPGVPPLPPLPDAGGVITETGQTVGGSLPVGGGVVTGTTGTVGGVVTGVQGTTTTTVGDVVDGVLGGGTGGLPTDALDTLLATLLGGSGPGGTGPGGTGSGPDGTGSVVNGQNGVVDGAAPNATVKVLSKISQIHKTGNLRLEVGSDEAGLVAVGGALRPGLAKKAKKTAKKKKARAKARAAAKRKGKAKPKAKHSRALIKFPAAVLAFRKAGKLVVTVKLGKQARQTLGRSRDARISLALVAADVFKNQTATAVKKTIAR